MDTLTRTFSKVNATNHVALRTEVGSSSVLIGLVTVLTTLALYQLILAPTSSLRTKSKIQPIFSLVPWLGSIDFYSNRIGFLRKHFGHPEDPASFHGGTRRLTVRDAPVILLAGDKDDARTFFYSRTLKFTQAYAKLFSGVPTDITSQATMETDKADAMFRENLKVAIRGERLARLAPQMCDDTLRSLRALPEWNKGSGTFDPKAFTFPLLFCMSMRTVGFADLSEQPDIMEKLSEWYWAMENASSYWSTFFTKYPFRSSRIKEESGKKLFAALGEAAGRRLREGVVEDDTVGMLLDKGLGPDYAVRFVVSSLFAAIINSTAISMWILLFLGANPAMRRRASDEVRAYLDGMAERQGAGWSARSRVEQLQALTLDEWEKGFPTIEACLKETMRVVLDGTLFRVHAGDSKKGEQPRVGGEDVPRGQYLAYWLGATHYNAQIYSDPHTWDPDRWARGEGAGSMDFLGWGTGMHPCTGMRFAKLEIKNFTTTILALLHWETVDPRSGRAYTNATLPPARQSSNDRMPEGPVAVRFTRL